MSDNEKSFDEAAQYKLMELGYTRNQETAAKAAETVQKAIDANKPTLSYEQELLAEIRALRAATEDKNFAKIDGRDLMSKGFARTAEENAVKAAIHEEQDRLNRLSAAQRGLEETKAMFAKFEADITRLTK